MANNTITFDPAAGVSYSTELFILSSDLWTGFRNQLYAHAGWRWSAGFEFLKFPNMPLRLGFAYGGPTFKELGLGFGYHTGPMIFDFGFGFKNGVWIHSMQGLNLSLQLTITSFKGRDSTKKSEPSTEGPTPLPIEENNEKMDNTNNEEINEAPEESLSG